jgi:SAM-dependent methyltransferase
MREIDANRRRWDELAGRHLRSPSYPVREVVGGASTLRRLELEALGDVGGKKILHLQCHIGLDTISWSRRGADVLGVDFSAESITLARRIAKDCGADALFVQEDVMDIADRIDGAFDFVVATYGVLCWIPDVGRYMANAAALLKEGGRLLLIDDHPFTELLDPDTGEVSGSLSYFSPGPCDCCRSSSYADGTDGLENAENWQWAHGLGEIASAASRHFGRILVKEHPFAHYRKFPSLVLSGDGYWHPMRQSMPLLFSLEATRPQR